MCSQIIHFVEFFFHQNTRRRRKYPRFDLKSLKAYLLYISGNQVIQAFFQKNKEETRLSTNNDCHESKSSKTFLNSVPHDSQRQFFFAMNFSLLSPCLYHVLILCRRSVYNNVSGSFFFSLFLAARSNGRSTLRHAELNSFAVSSIAIHSDFFLRFSS